MKSTKLLTTLILALTLGHSAFATALVPEATPSWSPPHYIPVSGYLSSQHGGIKPWIGLLTTYTCTDSGFYGLGSLGYAECYGTWTVKFQWLGKSSPPIKGYAISVVEGAKASGTNVNTSVMGAGTYRYANCYPIQQGNTWWVQCSVTESAIAHQISRLKSWSGTATCSVSGATVK